MTLDLEAGRRAGAAKVREFKQRQLRAQRNLQPDPDPDTPPPNGSDAPQPFPIVWSEDAQPVLQSTALITGVVARGEFSIWYGAYGSGKSFVAIDVFYHVAAGKNWNGYRVYKAPVLYVTLEGRARFPNRVAAVRERYDWPNVWFAHSTVSVDLRTQPNDALRLVATARQIMARCGVDTICVVIDTYTRALAGGSDVKPEHVNPFLANVALITEAIPEAHVAVIHHAGKDEAKGPRGWSGLPAAVETEIELTRKGDIRTLSVTKQRDDQDGAQIAFRLETVILGNNQFDEPVTSCIVEYLDVTPAGRAKLSPQLQFALDQLHRAVADDGKIVPASSYTPERARGTTIEIWRNYCYRAGISPSDNAGVLSPRLQSRLSRSPAPPFNRHLDKLGLG